MALKKKYFWLNFNKIGIISILSLISSTGALLNVALNYNRLHDWYMNVDKMSSDQSHLTLNISLAVIIGFVLLWIILSITCFNCWKKAKTEPVYANEVIILDGGVEIGGNVEVCVEAPVVELEFEAPTVEIEVDLEAPEVEIEVDVEAEVEVEVAVEAEVEVEVEVEA